MDKAGGRSHWAVTALVGALIPGWWGFTAWVSREVRPWAIHWTGTFMAVGLVATYACLWLVAIARTADRLFQHELDVNEREIGRRLLLRLTELGDGTADTRRRVAYETDPDFALRPPLRPVLNRLTDAAQTTGEHTAEVAHEALIREWPTRTWLSEDRACGCTARHRRQPTSGGHGARSRCAYRGTRRLGTIGLPHPGR
jgi:hypothetical protein